MKDSDFIFKEGWADPQEENDTYLEGEYSPGDTVIVNGEEFEIIEFVKAKEVQDSLGFISVYSWYKANTPEGKPTNLFFFDSDIDSEEKNDKVAEEWFDNYAENI